jgi:tetratricopeptide (TPR) repeat protein
MNQRIALNHHQPHALSRYAAVTEGVIEKCQQDYRACRDLGRSIPGLSAIEATVVAVESLAGDTLVHASLDIILFQPFGPLDDWSLAVLAEILFSIADQMWGRKWLLKRRQRMILDRAWAALEQALDSPAASPLLWYEDIFFDVAQEYRVKGDRRAIELLVRGIAHNLQRNKGSNVDSLLRDLAETDLWLGELDQGLMILTALLHNDPADIWTYNLAAITFDRFGLVDLGIEAARRGLEVLAVTGDPEGLHDQFVRSLDDLQRSKKRDREAQVDPSVLADSRAALSLDLDAGLHRPISELCRELVPDLDQVTVKGRPKAPDLPPYPQQKQDAQATAGRRARRRRKKKKKRR